MTFKIKTLLLLVAIGLVFNACDEGENNDNNQNVFSTEEVLVALGEYINVSEEFKDANAGAEEAQLNAQEQLNSGTQKIGVNADSVIVTIDPFDFFTFPKTITADFGINGILGPDGITRKGKIVSTINAWGFEEGSIRNSVFENYYHDSYQIEGNVESANLGFNDDSLLVVEVTIENGAYISADNDTVFFERNTTLTYLAGYDTKLDVWDDEYSIEGAEECISSDGIKLTITIVEPLIFSTLTKVKGGVLSVKADNFILPIVIDYDEQETRIGGIAFPFE